MNSSSSTVARWQLIFLYGVFCFNTFTIALTGGSIIFLYFFSLYRILKYRDFSLNPSHRNFLYTFLLFWLVYILTSIISPYEMYIGSAIRTNWRFFLPFIICIVLEDVHIETLLRTLFCFLVLISIYGIIQHFTGIGMAAPYDFNSYHARGNYSHHLTYGGVILLSFALYSSLSFCPKISHFDRWFYRIGTLTIFLAIIASLARSIWLGTVVALAILLLQFAKKLFFTLLLGVVALAFYFNLQTFEQSTDETSLLPINALQQRFTSTFDPTQNTDRLMMWKSAIMSAEDHFWFGIGIKNDTQALEKYRQMVSTEYGRDFQHVAGVGVHNIYLQTLVTTGIIGLASYLLIWLLFYLKSISALRQASQILEYYLLVGCMAGIAGFLFAGIFENNFRDAEVQTMVFIILGIALYSMRRLEKKRF